MVCEKQNGEEMKWHNIVTPITRHGSHRKHRLQQFLQPIRCLAVDVFTQPLPRNERPLNSAIACLPCSSLATADFSC
jgi:hypothetical protein